MVEVIKIDKLELIVVNLDNIFLRKAYTIKDNAYDF